jgi:Cu(I)/Ag(I) efflux system protein CusF
MKFIAVFLTAAACLAPAYAQPPEHQASGKVTKVDRAAGRVTIAHGPVASLKWPAMTMAFEVRDKALFDKLQPGASVEFSFVEQNRKHMVTEVR